MMVINTGEGLPETVGVVLARWAWRYRSELAPVGVAAALAGVAWWLHRTRPHWWVLVAVLAGVAAWAVAMFGARWRLPARIERVYAAVTIYAAGIWLGAATALGPSVPPLPRVGVIGAVILSIPWWTHRRRRAKVRLERKLQAWPDIAKAIGLAGAEVMSATVDVWGWRARFRLARGQTIKDVVAKIPAIESGLGTFRVSLRKSCDGGCGVLRGRGCGTPGGVRDLPVTTVFAVVRGCGGWGSGGRGRCRGAVRRRGVR